MSDRISKYWPDVYKKIQDFREIGKTVTIEIEQLSAEMQRVLDNSFIETADARTIKRLEKPLGIQANPSENLNFRRRRLLNRYQTKPPFTVRWLQRQLDRLVGSGMTIVSIDYANQVLTITANIGDANVFNEVQHTVNTIKPANMIYQHNTSTRDVIGLKEHISKQEITWNYILDGSWQLGDELPFATFGEKEVIK